MIVNLIRDKIGGIRNPLYLNSLYISLSSVIGSIAGFLFWNIASRFYSSSDVGIASALISSLNLIYIISMIGLNISLIRFYPEYKEKAIQSAILIVSSVALIISLIYVMIVGKLSNNLKILLFPKYLIPFVLFSVLISLYYILGTALIAMRKGKNYFIQWVLFSWRFIFLFFMLSLGTLGIFCSFGIGLILGVCYAFFTLRKYISFTIDRGYLSSAFKFSLANYIANILNFAPTYIMPTIVLSTLGRSEAAYFYIAFTIGNLILLVPNAINMSFFVECSHGARTKDVLRRALLVSYIYLGLVVAIVYFFGDSILMLFGEEYTEGFSLLKIVALTSFFVVVVNFYVTVLNIQKKIKDVIVVNFLRTIIFLSLSYPLMVKFGITGIGYAWLIAWGILMFSVFLKEVGQ